MAQKNTFEKELDALKTVLEALTGLGDKGKQFVLRTAIERLEVSDIQIGGGGTGGVTSTTSGHTPSLPLAAKSHAASNPMSAKAFLRSKKPKSDVQQVVVLAYYLTHHSNTDVFKTQDIVQLNTDAGGARISNPHRAIDNAARRSAYLIPVSGGKKKITAHGEEIVEALPNQDEVKRIEAEHKPSSRRRAKKKRAKKGAK